MLYRCLCCIDLLVAADPAVVARPFLGVEGRRALGAMPLS
jgi:hypothetical protein